MPEDTRFTQVTRRSELDHDQSQDMAEVVEVLRQADFADEIGSTGLRRFSGFVEEEFLPQLRGRKAIGVFREMSENEPLVGAFLQAITMLLRNVEWTVKPGGNSARDARYAEFLEECTQDMSVTWEDFISEVLSMLVFGFSWHEMVFKRRNGPWNPDPRQHSAFSDGLIGIRKMPIRSQETLFRWVFDDSGDVRAMVQMAPPKYTTTTIPIEKSLLFRLWGPKGNPEGRSLLRNAYRPWYMKKRMEEFEAIGVERDLAGYPIIKVPAEYLRKDATPQQKNVVTQMRKMVRTIRRNEQEGAIFPMAYDQDTRQPLFDLSLLGSGGSRQFQTDPIIQRYEQRMLMSVLADFIMVGHQTTGSYSLHTDKTGIFRTSLNAIAQSIAATLNRHMVPKLFRVNRFTDVDKLPEFAPTDVDSPDIAVLSQFMTAMASMGVQWFPDADLEQFVRKAARLPLLTDDDENRERLLSRRAEATRFMQQQAEYVQTRMGLQQAIAGVGPQDPTMQQPGQPGQPGQSGQPGQQGQQPRPGGPAPQVGARQQPGNRQQGGQ